MVIIAVCGEKEDRFEGVAGVCELCVYARRECLPRALLIILCMRQRQRTSERTSLDHWLTLSGTARWNARPKSMTKHFLCVIARDLSTRWNSDAL